ncbi:Restriction endonuclease [Formivibrio citricus]|uniref:Restriction endonuclease n=1 Tax=Formivibrio citricus TaxID=83765 RepID=A0A1I4Z378_9NEIS|nr:restriction endonuclease [Formivibrio citricus]SFN44721.1 Restriction endonuclease [Formivibrio citricus]
MPTPQAIKDKYAELCAPPDDADAVWFRQRGYQFEVLLADLLRADSLDPRTSYKAPGEQIDGSFFLDGSVFLLEAKWHKDEIPASTLYQFKGKVDGKLVGTIGIFLSMSGYSKDAVDALTLGKSLNLVLFDKRDIDVAINRDLGFRTVLKRKLRQAAEEGIVYFPTEAELVTGSNSQKIDIERLGYDSATGNVFSQQVPSTSTADLIVVCEGESDRELIAYLAGRILSTTNSRKAIKIVVAMGKFSVPRVANAVHALGTLAPKVLIVVDSDGDTEKSFEMLKRNIDFEGWVAAIPEPEIESWLGLDRRTLQRSGPGMRTTLSLQAAERVNIEQLRKSDKAFATFYTAVSET